MRLVGVASLLGWLVAPVHAGVATSFVPSVTVPCSSCVTYQDISNQALITARQLGWGNYTPPGYPAGTVASPLHTKILVSATTVPRSYAFTYQSHVQRCVTCFNADANIYTYTISPITTYADPTDDGATHMDVLLYKALRQSGLPTISVPPFAANGTPINASSEVDVITAAVTALMPAVGIPGTLKTLPGLFNWTLFPSITVVYKGKSYTLYEGEEVNVVFSDGTKATLIVRVGKYGGSPGFFEVKLPQSGSNQPIPTPPAGTSTGMNSLDPGSSTFTGGQFFVFGNPSYGPGIVISGPLVGVPSYEVDVGP